MALIKLNTRSLTDDSVTTDKLVNDGNLGRRNLIINGGMQVAQRGTSATSLSAGGYHTVDRFQYYVNAFDELRTTMSQDSSVPTGADSGFSKSLKLDCTTAESAIAADENLRVWQIIEAQNLIRLGYGTSGAKTCTLSFYVKSSLTGTYAVSFWCQDPNRNISKTYTINSANTWEKKTITIPGDTGGTGITNDNGEGMRINWFLNAGSNFTSTDTNNQWGAFASGRHAFGHTAAWGTNTSHDFFLTGVQFEVGETATDFEHRSFAEELRDCQRYYFHTYRQGIAIGSTGADNGAAQTRINSAVTNHHSFIVIYPVPMRATPVITYRSLTGTVDRVSHVGSDFSHDTNVNITATYEMGERGINGISIAASNLGIAGHVIANAEL